MQRRETLRLEQLRADRCPTTRHCQPTDRTRPMSRIAFRQWFRQLLRSAEVESRSTSSLRFESLEDRRLLATFAVLNTLDSGPGSLREAMIAANSTPGADQIEFAIASAAPHTINLASPLPVITEQVSIDATTQPGYTGVPIVELNGTSAGASARGSLSTTSITVKFWASQSIDLAALPLKSLLGQATESPATTSVLICRDRSHFRMDLGYSF